MVKMIGCFCIILASSFIGIRAATDLDAQYDELKYLQKIIYALQSEIQYHRAFLAEAFSNIAGFVKEPYNVWFRQLYYRLERKEEESLKSAWTETIDEYLIDAKLPKFQKDQLKELGNYLGSADVELQIKQMNHYREQLELATIEMREELENKKKICRCLGIVGGIFLAILLI